MAVRLLRQEASAIAFRLVAPGRPAGARSSDGRTGRRLPARTELERWEEIAAAATRHGLGPLLHRRLACSRDRSSRVPASVREEIRAVHSHSRLRNRSALAQLAELLAALEGEGIDGLVLKGPDLAERAYGDPALRPYQDLDLLLRPGRLEAGADVLRRLGYRQRRAPEGVVDYDRHRHLAPFHRSGALPVELHRRIHDPASGVEIDTGEIWERSVRAEIGGREVRVLSVADLVVHLAAHAGGNHRFEVPLLSVCDLAYLIERQGPDLDWGEVVARATGAGADRYLRALLGVTARNTGVSVPSRVLREPGQQNGPGDGRVDDLVSAHLFDGTAEELPAAVRRLRGSSAREARETFRQSLFPDREVLERMYPGLGDRWYHRAALRVFRPLHLAWRSLGFLWRLVRRDPSLRAASRKAARQRHLQRWVVEG